MRFHNTLTLSVSIVVAAIILAACAAAGGYNYQNAGGSLSNSVAQKLQAAVPYPASSMNTSQELINDRERLLRFNQSPHKIGYVYVMSALGKAIGYYTIDGPITSTQSQMTITDQINGCGDHSACVTASIGDNGSFGPEEGGPQGIFFFTTSGVLVETDQLFIYSDAPLPLGVPSLNPKKAPSSVSKFWKR